MQGDNLAVAAQIAGHHVSQPVHVRAVNPRRTVFRIEHDSRRLVLKLSRQSGEAGVEAIAKELSVLEFLSTTAVPVPSVEFADSKGDQFGRAYFLMESAGERTVDDNAREGMNIAPLCREMGKVLATVHQVSLASLACSTTSPLASRTSADSALAQKYWNASCQIADGLAQTGVLALADVRQLNSAAPPRFAGNQLCHSDYCAAQCVVEDGRLSAVVDWEAAWVGNAAIDVEIANGYLDLAGNPENKRAFEAGYESRLPQPRQPEWAVRMVFLVNVLNTLASQGAASWDYAERSGGVARAKNLFSQYASRLLD